MKQGRFNYNFQKTMAKNGLVWVIIILLLIGVGMTWQEEIQGFLTAIQIGLLLQTAQLPPGPSEPIEITLPEIMPEEAEEEPIEITEEPILEILTEELIGIGEEAEPKLSLAQIQEKVNEISEKVETISEGVAKLVEPIEKPKTEQEKQLRLAELQEQINEISAQVELISQQVAELAASSGAGV